MFGGFRRILVMRANQLGYSPSPEQAKEIELLTREQGKPGMSVSEGREIIDQVIRDVMEGLGKAKES
jgi:hypothetical protein